MTLQARLKKQLARENKERCKKITKVNCGKYCGTKDIPITDKKRRLLTSEKEIDARWAEYFSEVLNRPPPTSKADIQEAEHDLDINTAPPELNLI